MRANPQDDDDEFMLVDPENRFWNRPELGVVERRVATTFEEGLFQEEVDPVAMEYWFQEPPGGWQTEPRRLRKLPVEPWDPMDDSVHNPGPGRLPLDQIREGQVFTGIITNGMYYHGAQVDIGAEYDGLIPVSERLEWRAVENDLDVGTALEVRVYKLRDPTLFRFPVQLVPTDPRLAAKLPPPEDHEAPMDMRDPKLSQEELAAISGRDYAPKKFIVEMEGQGRRREFKPVVDPVWDEVSDQQLEAFDRLHSQLMRMDICR